MRLSRRLFALCVTLACATIAAPSQAVDVVVLTADNYAEFVPQGKEVDAIIGDIVLRNDKLVAVIAQPLPTRNANMTVKNAGGCLIDFTTRENQNDQLGAFFPLGKATNWRRWTIEPSVDKDGKPTTAAVVVVRVTAVVVEGKLEAETKYVLADGAAYLAVETKLTNLSAEPITRTVVDESRTDGTVYIKGKAGDLAWAYDRWWMAAYGFLAERFTSRSSSQAVVAAGRGTAPKQEYAIPANGTLTLERRIFVAADLGQLLEVVKADAHPETALGDRTVAGYVDVREFKRNSPRFSESRSATPGIHVQVECDGQVVTAGTTGEFGRFHCQLPLDKPYSVIVSSSARLETKHDLEAGTREAVVDGGPVPGTVSAQITDAAGGPTPCKVQFRGIGETKDPYFFDKSGEHAVGNLYYSHGGKFEIAMPPGTYLCTVSRGPEYDDIETAIAVKSDETTQLSAKLVRSVDTTGWISTDYHNHASPSGDNVSSQYGRVLNLLCEHVEFAPCTEHNRISTYEPHLKRLKVEHLLASCSGMELTSTPLPLGHLNAFPLKMHSHTQDGGGPATDLDIELQVARLALWDDRSDKLVQQNHPDLGWLFYDKNGDGVPDGGHSQVLPHLDVIEVHPPHEIFSTPIVKNRKGETENNTILKWIQMINQGVRVPGVVNTDAHYNIHGSGWLRNWIASPTDDPAKIQVLDVVHESEHGHIVMSNGPFMTVAATANGSQKPAAIPGDELLATGGKVALAVKVQCPNWFDVDRVQVFVNGRPEAKLNFTREQMPDAFGDKVVKFDRRIEIDLPTDAHLIVVAIGEKSQLGHVMGPEHEKTKPIAVSNPIFVDVDGGGFKANGDTLGMPLPVKAGMAK